MRRVIGVGTFLFGLLFVFPGHAEYPNWNDLAGVQVIEVITVDPDGNVRETKVWFVLLGGEAYLRTNGSRWLENLRRDPELIVRVEDREYEAKAEEIQSEAIVQKIDIASQRKYGLQERLIGFFRTGTPDILKLSPRESLPGRPTPSDSD